MTETILPLAESDLADVLGLNNANAAATSVLDLAALRTLAGAAFYARGIGGGSDAFLIAMDQDAAYDSPNFLWFKARLPRFVYIDRVITAEHARGRGLARRLYADLFAKAAADGNLRVGCEVNLDPPNPVSDALHASLGFAEVGRAAIDGGKKIVRYYERGLSPADR